MTLRYGPGEPTKMILATTQQHKTTSLVLVLYVLVVVMQMEGTFEVPVGPRDSQ